jgi:DNA adenine methylase
VHCIRHLNDTPEVRSIFSSFKICDVSLTYTIGGGQAKPVGEVLIMDRKQPAVPNMPE